MVSLNERDETQVELILPGKAENITVNIIGIPYMAEFLCRDLFGDPITVKDVCCDVNIFGDLENNIFKIRMDKLLWNPLYEELLSEVMKNKKKIDTELKCLMGKIISIWGTPDLNIDSSYFGHFGCMKHIDELPKIFEVKIRSDIEKEVKRGKKFLEDVIEKEVYTNVLTWECIIRNFDMINDKEHNNMFVRTVKLRSEWLRKLDN